MNKNEINKAIKTLRSFYGSLAKIPVEELMQQCELSKEEAIDALAAYEVPKQVKPRKKRTITKPPIENKPKVVKKKHKLHDVALHILPWAAGLIALAALIRTTLFNWSYFSRTESDWIAVIMSFIIGAAVFLTPSLVVESVKLRNWWTFSAAVIAFLGFGALNVYITIQELDHQKTIIESWTPEQVEVIKARSRCEQIEIDLITNTTKWNVDIVEAERLGKLQSDPNMKDWERVQQRRDIAVVQKRLEDYKKIENSLISERNGLQKIEGYYTMALLTENDKQVGRAMDGWMAVTLEVAGPLFLMLALFL